MSNKSENGKPRSRRRKAKQKDAVPPLDLNSTPQPTGLPPTRPRRPGELPDLRSGSFQDLLQTLGIARWDAVIVGDGSGSGWGQGAGWASVVVRRDGRRSPLLRGAHSHGTVNIAELQALLLGLMWLEEQGDGPALRRAGGGMADVHLVTDSEITVNQGNGKSTAHGINRVLWAGVRLLERDGYRLHFHWYPRDQIQLNMLCDHASRQSRLAVEAVTIESLLETNSLSVYDFNPLG